MRSSYSQSARHFFSLQTAIVILLKHLHEQGVKWQRVECPLDGIDLPQ